mgnify:CR=1 FL=1
MNAESEPTRGEPVRTWAALVALLAAAVYANTLGHGFVWDDNTIVLGDPAIRSLSSIPSFFARSYWGEADPEFKLYRPLVQTTLAIDWAIGRGSAVPFHATNLLLHVLATLLAFHLFRGLHDELPWAVLASALFAVHPVHTDAVDSIVQRAELLSAIGVMGGLLAALRGRWLVLALCAAVGLLSKETAAMLPLLLAGWHLLGDRARRPRWPAYAVSIGVLALYGVARWKVLGTATGMHAAFGDVSVGERALTMTWVFGDYVRLLLVPWPLCADYAVNTNPLVRVTSAADPRFLSAALALSTLAIVWCVAAARRWRGAFWGAWAAIALLPVSNVLLPIGAIEAERFLYLPSVGACALLAWIFAGSRAQRIGLVIVILFALVTLDRNQVWKDHLTLLDARMAEAPENPWPYFRRAEILLNEGRLREAEPYLDHALEVMPNFEKARQLRAGVRYGVGRMKGAAEDLEALLTAHPDWWQTMVALGSAYGRLGDWERFEATLERLRSAGHPADADSLDREFQD